MLICTFPRRSRLARQCVKHKVGLGTLFPKIHVLWPVGRILHKQCMLLSGVLTTQVSLEEIGVVPRQPPNWTKGTLGLAFPKIGCALVVLARKDNPHTPLKTETLQSLGVQQPFTLLWSYPTEMFLALKTSLLDTIDFATRPTLVPRKVVT